MPPTAAEVPPIDPAQSQAISAARQLRRRFAFAIKLAKWNGVSLLLAAAISLVLSAFDTGLLLSAAMLGGCGWLELAAGRRLGRHEPRALIWLAGNQLLLLAAVAIYAGLQVRAVLAGQASLLAELQRHPERAGMLAAVDDPALTDMIDSMDDMYRYGQLLVYAVLIGVSLILQGGAALYYLSRRRYLREFLAGTPEWVVEHLRRDE
jgi:hypothetical protein